MADLTKASGRSGSVLGASPGALLLCTGAAAAPGDRLCARVGRFSSTHCAGPRQTRLDERRPDHQRRPDPQRRPQPEPQLKAEHRAGAESLPTKAPPSPRRTTTPYQGWFRPETTTSVWLASNSLDDLAQAQRQESAAGQAAAGVLLLITAALLATVAAH